MNLALTKSIKVLLFLFLLFAILIYAKPFLVPVVFASLLSMLLLPLSVKLENWGLNKTWSIVLSILALVTFLAGIIGLLVWQVSDMLSNASSIEENINEKITQIRDYITNSLKIPPQKQQEIIQKQQSSSSSKMANAISKSLSSMGTLLTNLLLVLIYVFLFMFFRAHLKKFVLQLVHQDKKHTAIDIIENSRKVAQKYITGLGLMIVCLWIMYGIGFSIVGVKSPIFFAILCGLLEIVPFIGNLIGTLLTILLTLAQGGDMSTVIGIVITYGLVQFTQSYIIEPLVVGKEVSINPLFTIMGIVGGELIWGIPGMILSIPVLGILKIVFDRIEMLKPYGFLIGETKNNGDTNIITKIKSKIFKR